jgi:uncharacterized protein YqeY
MPKAFPGLAFLFPPSFFEAPMSLTTRLEQEYISAYKAKDSIRLSVLRLLKTAMKNFQVERLRPPTDDDVLDLIARQCKQRQDSIDQYTAASRPDLADREAAEMDILRGYMPPRLDGDELAAAIAAAISEVGAREVKDMGKVMQALLAAHKGRIDGKAASEAVRAALQRPG